MIAVLGGQRALTAKYRKVEAKRSAPDEQTDTIAPSLAKLEKERTAFETYREAEDARLTATAEKAMGAAGKRNRK